MSGRQIDKQVDVCRGRDVCIGIDLYVNVEVDQRYVDIEIQIFCLFHPVDSES